MFELFFGIILMAIVIEGIISYTKQIVVEKKLQWQVIMAIILGVIVAIAYQLDLFSLFDMTSNIPYLGMILTGVLMSRGSNYIFDFIKQIQSVKNEE